MFDRHLFTSPRSARETNERPSPMFPLPVLDSRTPVVLVFDPEDRGIEIAYERNPHAGPLVRSATRESTLYDIPAFTPVLAVADGKIIYGGKHTDGHVVLVEHRNGWSSYYGHLEHMFVTPSEQRPREARVRRGDILGYVGAASQRRTLRFELWRYAADEEYEPVDPIRYVHRWRLCPWVPPDRSAKQT